MNDKSVVQVQSGASSLLPLSAATAGVLVLWLVYVGIEALIYSGTITVPPSAALEFVPGILAVAVLIAAGFSARDCFLRAARLSRRGLLALLAPMPLMLAVYLTGKFVGASALTLLVYAPAGALSQALYFRCALLPLLLRLLKGRVFLAIFLAALIHGLWHIGPIVQGAPWYGAIPVMLVPFLAGIAWNWQVRNDRTVLWSAILHIFVDQSITVFIHG